jgi:hypothetical protein
MSEESLQFIIAVIALFFGSIAIALVCFGGREWRKQRSESE